VRAFAYFDGVPQRVVYDNLTAAVKMRVGLRRVGLKRELTDRFEACLIAMLLPLPSSIP